MTESKNHFFSLSPSLPLSLPVSKVPSVIAESCIGFNCICFDARLLTPNHQAKLARFKYGNSFQALVDVCLASHSVEAPRDTSMSVWRQAAQKESLWRPIGLCRGGCEDHHRCKLQSNESF